MLDSNSNIPAKSGQLDSIEDIKKAAENPERARVLRWVLELENADKVFEDYHKRIDAITARYRDDRKTDESTSVGERRYNALWSMVQTLKPLLYSDVPVPYVERVHDDDDPIARDASLILQRTLTAMSSCDGFSDALSEAVDDYVMAGRGQTWLAYLPEFAIRESDVKEYVEDEDEIPEDEYADPDEKGARPKYKAEKDDAGKTYYRKKIEYKSDEKVVLESVNNKDILHGPATRWRHVPWVARRVPMLRSEAIKRFGSKIGNALPLAAKEQSNPRAQAPNTDDFKGQFARAVVWEIWDRVNRKVIWICPDWPEKVLDEKGDELQLEGFFPCAKPMFGTMTNDTLIPVPDYTEWQDIALELDDVTHRIHLLISALRVVGVYSAQYGVEMQELLKPEKKNKMIAVSNWAMFAEKGGLKGAVDFFPIENVIQVLDKLYEVRARLVQELYEITGISDIVRGASDPRETAAAQKIKGNFANARLTTRQKLVARHARECLVIMAEMACSLFSDEKLMAMSGALNLFATEDKKFDTPRWHAALALLRNEPMRILRVKIDTESLAESTLLADREEATQFLTALGGYMQQSVMMLQQAPNMGNLLSKLLLFAVRKYKVGRQLETDVESAIRQLAKTGLGQPQDAQQGAGDPGMNSLEANVEMQKNEIARQKLEIDKQKLELEKAKMQFDQQKGVWEAQAREKDIGIKGFKAHQDVRLKDKQIDVQAQGQQQQTMLQQQAQQHEQQISQQQLAQDQQAMQHEQQMGQADLQMRHVEHQAGREDAAAAQQQQQAEFEAGRQDQAADRQERATQMKLSQRNADADRKVKVQQARQKATQAARPKPKA